MVRRATEAGDLEDDAKAQALVGAGERTMFSGMVIVH